MSEYNSMQIVLEDFNVHIGLERAGWEEVTGGMGRWQKI